MDNGNMKEFDVDSNINSGLFTVIVIITYIMIFLFIIIFLNALINYLLFQYHNVNKMILESDPYNLEKIKMHEAYEYSLIDYIYCSKNIDNNPSESQYDILSYIWKSTDKIDTNASSCKAELKNSMDSSIEIFKKLLRSDKCNIEPFWNIYGENKFHTLCIQLLYLIIMIMLIGSTIYLIIRIFLSMRLWNVKGINLISYFYKNGELYAYIIMLVFVFCLLHSFLFKYLFVDSIYDKLYQNYIELVKLDAYIHNEMKNIQEENIFLNLLTNSTVYNVDIEYELNTHNKKLIDNIKDSKNDDIRATKIFLYAVYIYVERQNPDDLEIINKLNSIATSNPDNMKTLRSFLLYSLNNVSLSSELNNIISIILFKLDLKGDEYELFDFNNYTEWEDTTLKYKIAYKINKFYEILMKMADTLDLNRSIWEFNIYFIVMLSKSLVFLLLLLTLMYIYSDKDPFFQKLIKFVIEGIKNMVDDMKWTMVM